MTSRKVTTATDPSVRATFPIGQRVTLYGGTVSGVVKGYRRTNLNGMLVIVEYVNSWDDGYSETRRIHAAPSQLTIVRQEHNQ